MHIRLAELRDLHALTELRCALWPEDASDDLASFARAAIEGRPESTLPLVSFVAERDGGALVGFIEVGLRSHAEGCDANNPVGFIEGWYVAPEVRRQGVGRALVREAEDWARAQGCSEMASNTWANNVLSEQAHLGLGYEVAERCVHFRKSIPVQQNRLLDGRVHQHVISSFVERGFASNALEIAAALSIAREDAEASLRRLQQEHGLVLHPSSTEVWLAHPFSSSPTPVWVASGDRGWWAPCIWCATGVVTLAAPSATIVARYGGESTEARIDFRDGASSSESIVVHFPTPPRTAWANVVDWCATVQPFRSAEDVHAWCTRHRRPPGAIVPLAQVLALGRAWYGRHLDVEWKKWTLAEAQAIFDEVGLTGEFWRLPVAKGRF